MEENRHHALFQRFPLTGQVAISTGSVPTPYHVYDGHGLLIGGTVDLKAAQNLLQNETVTAVQTRSGRALMLIWVCDFTDASLGVHHELQFSLLVTRRPQPPLPDHPLALLQAMIDNPTTGLLCHGLWNNSAVVVAYNRELLGLPACLSAGEIVRENGRKSFTFCDDTGQLILHGQVGEAASTPAGAGWQMMRLFGLRRTFRLLREPYLASAVINPISQAIPCNAQSPAYIAANTPVVQFFQPQTDTLTIVREPYGRLNFQPQFLEHFAPFRFVYLMPSAD